MRRVVHQPAALWAAIVLVALLVLLGSFAVIPESQQVIVVRFDKPVRILNRYQPGQSIGATGAGLAWRLPYPFERLIRIDKRVLDVDMAPQPVTSVDQRRLLVDSYARFRVVDPLRMYERVGDEQQLADQLRPILGSALRDQLGTQSYSALLTANGGLMQSVRAALDRVARPYGVEIMDVQLGKAGLAAGPPLQAALDTMRNARAQQARTIRLQGLKTVEAIQDQADARAAQIYAASFGKDAEFYDFYRAMQSYRATLGGEQDSKSSPPVTIILSPNDDYLKQFVGHPR